MVISRLMASLRGRGHVVMAALAGPGSRQAPDAWVCPLYVRTPAAARSVWSRPYHIPSLARLLAGLIKRRPDIVNVHIITGQAIYFMLLKRLFGYKTVVSAHGSDILKPAQGCREHLPKVLRRADAVTVVSSDLAEKVLTHPGVDPAKIHVIPNGVDCEFWSPEDGASGDPGSPPVVVAVGRLEHVKGFDVLLLALARLRRTIPTARVCIIGDGIARGELEQQARSLGLADAVELTGFLDKEKVRERLRKAAAFALSSRSEGMPLALLEAMACGVPPVAARVGGVPEVVTAGTGILVSPDAPDELADGLARLLQDRDLASRLGSAAHRRAQAYSSASSDAAYERVFERLLRG